MNRTNLWMIVCVTLALVTLARPASANGDDADKRLSVTVSFGVGLNTAQPGNAANHHIVPPTTRDVKNNIPTIRIRTGGVVNFDVAGFHWIWVYQEGIKRNQIVVPAAGTFVNFRPDLLYYQGIAPAGGPLATAETGNPSNGSNRVEPVSFLQPGTYLVICNVRGHLLDGMFAYIVVQNDDDDEDDDDGGHGGHN